MDQPTFYKALKQMSKLSEDNIAFSFSYVTYSESNQTGGKLKRVKRAKLRTGLSADKGIKSRTLVGYIDLDTNENRWFNLPLLLTFNQIDLV